MANDPLISKLRAKRLAEEIKKAEKADPYASRSKIREIAKEEAEKLPFDPSPIAIGKEIADKAKRGR